VQPNTGTGTLVRLREDEGAVKILAASWMEIDED
jgi:hypothetical protein